jgi:hypothetical protein
LLLALSACGSSTSEGATATTSTDVTTEVLTAEEGAIARAELEAATNRGGVGASLAADTMPIDCGAGGEPYVPTAEELATFNADAEALAATLDTYGIAYEKTTDDLGFVSVVTDWKDAVAQAVVDSFWADRYPPEPLPAEEVARIRAENDKLATALDEAGVAFTRQTDRWGNEWLEWDYADANAQAAVDAVYAELYPPVPPSAEDLAVMRAENDKLAAAFDAAGVAYTRESDEAGWEWIAWDYEDPATSAVVDAVFAELYPVDLTIDPMPCPLVDDPATSGVAEEGAIEEGTVDAEPSDTEIMIDPIAELTPEQEAQRVADVEAMDAGFTAAGVDFWVVGEAPWISLTFDTTNPAAVGVIQTILAARG